MKAKAEDIATRKGKVLRLVLRGLITPREAADYFEDLSGLNLSNMSREALEQMKSHVNAEIAKLGTDRCNGRTTRGGTR